MFGILVSLFSTLMQTFTQVLPYSVIRHPRSASLKGSFNSGVDDIAVSCFGTFFFFFFNR